jgi:PiT family inorganic phosphate transporter
MASLAILIVAAAASLFMAWAIGAGSSGSTPFAPAVGANAISVMRAGFVVGLLGFAGAVLQGANVTEAVGTQLIGGVSLTATAAIVGLLTAAILVAIGVFTGYPIATAFTVTGAVVGVGLALGGDPA